MSLGIGIIGSGYMGRTYAECLAHHVRGARLVAVAGGSRAPRLGADYGVPVDASVEALLARRDVNAVIVASPHAAHAAQTVAAARAGKQVLVEKPMALTSADCTAMIEACRAAGVTLSVVKTFRYRTAMREAHRLIQQGRIGRVQMLQVWWLFTQPPLPGGIARDLRQRALFINAGVHVFDHVRWLMNEEPTRVFATLANHTGVEGVPSLMAQFAFAEGRSAGVWLSYELPDPGWDRASFRSRVVGETGLIDVDAYGTLRLGTGAGWTTILQQAPIDFVNRPLDPVRLEAFVALVQDFVDAVRDSRPPAVTGEDGRAAVQLAEACAQSSAIGEAIALEGTE